MMTEHQFDQRLRHIEEQFFARKESAVAYRDQELARLFEECGWTQDRIAERMGKRQDWVSRRLTFGRFLRFMPTGHNSDSLTERRFREHWRMTKGTEAERFRQVAESWR